MKKLLAVGLIMSLGVLSLNAKQFDRYYDNFIKVNPKKERISDFRQKIRHNEIKIQKLWEKIQVLEQKNNRYFHKIKRIKEKNHHRRYGYLR